MLVCHPLTPTLSPKGERGLPGSRTVSNLSLRERSIRPEDGSGEGAVLFGTDQSPRGFRSSIRYAGFNNGRALSGTYFQAFLIASLLLIAPGAAASPDLRIGQITIRTVDVFSPDEASKGWFYRATNVLHVQTRMSVIRKFLLFREGDPYDPNRLAESERNLRQLGFLKLATVTAGAPRDSVVDVEVSTQDTWTTEPGISYGYKGGRTTYGFQLKEKNLFGTGRAILFNYDKELDRIIRSVEIKDPRLFGPYWNGHVTFAANSDGHERLAQIERPFYSFTTPWALSTVYDDLQQTERIYQAARLSSAFRQDHTQIKVDLGVALTANPVHARRLSLGFEALDDRFRHVSGRFDDTLPDSRRFRYLFLAYEDLENDFLKLNYVHRGLRFEDFSLARELSARIALSPAAFGGGRSTLHLRLIGHEGARLGKYGFVQGGISYETRWDQRPHNAILSASGACIIKYATPVIQTTVMRLQYDRGWHLDRDVQFVADGETGLRAYRVHAFAGDRRIIGNIEHRIFARRELLQLVAPGAAVFCDFGAAAPPGQTLRLADIRSDIGAGLRLGMARAESHNIIRIDFAYALNRDPLGRGRFLISFASGQAF
jgi:hypothetical protein